MIQKTFSIKQSEITRKWYVVDATDKVLGRLAVKLATILQGKHKPEYTPHMDTGDYIVVINAEKVKITGKKSKQKVYYHHTGYVGGLKEIPYERMLKKKPEKIILLAVQGMLPKTKLGKHMIKKLKVYAGPEHQHTAQQPVALNM